MTLEELKQQFEQDTSLPLAKGNRPVFGEGSPQAHILAIGEAPGFHENQQGRPFVGRSGQLLRKLLVEVGLDLRQDIYITNVVKHRPPENRDPTPEEIEAYRPYLDAQIRLIKPQIIVTLGRFSMHRFLPKAKISQVHGIAHWVTFEGRKILLIPMYHPAAALRGTRVMNLFKADFIKLKNALDYFETLGELPQELDEVDVSQLESSSSSKQQLSLLD